MRGEFHLRLVHVVGIMGATLGAIGFFLFYSAFLLDAFPTVATHTAGPGFWLMLIGFVLSIGSALWEALAGSVKPSAPRPL